MFYEKEICEEILSARMHVCDLLHDLKIYMLNVYIFLNIKIDIEE